MRRYIVILIVASVVSMAGFVAPQEPAPSQPSTDTQPSRSLVEPVESAAAQTPEIIDYKTEADQTPVASPEPDSSKPTKTSAAPNDPSFPKMWAMNNRGQTGGTFDADIDGLEAWRASSGGNTTVVAVVDTGIDIDHPDLDGNIWTNPDEIAGNNIDDDRNGYVDDVHGWDFANGDASVFDGDGDGHATHIAGTIAAEVDNGIGVTGIDSPVQVMSLKFMAPGGGPQEAAEAIDYAVAEGADIINCSWAYTDPKPLTNSINKAEAAGVLVVAAAMNGGEDFVGDDIDADPLYPASFDNSNIISVAATDDRDLLTPFSNYGAVSVDLAAPGKDILSTVLNDSYNYGLGTSMAAPHVTGVAALVKSEFPELDAAGIKARILDSVDKKPSLKGKTVTGGRLNAAKAIGANTSPTIFKQGPANRVRTQRPKVKMTVGDDETDLTRHRIELYVDGKRRTGFSYYQATDRLSYRTKKLAPRWHRVKVVAHDSGGLSETRTWRFKVIKHR